MKRTDVVLLGLGSVLVSACSDGTGPRPGLSLSFATREAPAAAYYSAVGAAAASDLVFSGDTISDGSNKLVITKAEIVLREIELKRQEVVDCDVSPEPEGCEDFEVGPVLIDLPLGEGAAKEVTIELPEGTYTEVEFEIHKVSKDDAEDAAFRAAHPDFIEKSIRVQGTYNGVAFSYESDLDVEQELDLVPPIVIADSVTATNLTIRVGLATWFVALDGSLVDPATGNKGGVNESLVKENIKRSVEAFEDRDQDGHDDD